MTSGVCGARRARFLFALSNDVAQDAPPAPDHLELDAAHGFSHPIYKLMFQLYTLPVFQSCCKRGSRRKSIHFSQDAIVDRYGRGVSDGAGLLG